MLTGDARRVLGRSRSGESPIREGVGGNLIGSRDEPNGDF
jgi:hypothetical protein